MSLPPNYLFDEVTPESVSTRTRVAVELALGRYRENLPPVVWGRFRDRLYWGVFHKEPPTIYLSADLGAREAAETALHELRHAEQARSPAWARVTKQERETDAQAWAREAIIPLERSWLPSLGPDSLERLCAADPPTGGDMAEQFAELQAWARTLRRAPHKTGLSRHFTAAGHEVFRASFRQGSSDLASGIFSGIASVFGSPVETWTPTVVDRGAFTKTLATDAKRVKILYQHDPNEPIGKPIEMRETDRGLEVVGKISMTTRGQQVLTLMRDGVLDELSIGFDPVVAEDVQQVDGSMVRHLKEVRLWEFSPVTFAADPHARITSLPSA